MKSIILGVLLSVSSLSFSQTDILNDTFRLYGEIQNIQTKHTFTEVWKYIPWLEEWEFYILTSWTDIHQIRLPLNTDYLIIFVNGDSLSTELFLSVSDVPGECLVDIDFNTNPYGLIYCHENQYQVVLGNEEDVFGEDPK
jgi:hypothetical protein